MDSANHRYTKTYIQHGTQGRQRQISFIIKGDSTVALSAICCNRTQGRGFAENGWTHMDTVYDPYDNGKPAKRYAKMLYNQTIFPQIKPPVKSLFGHSPADSASWS